MFKASYGSENATVLVKSWPGQYLGDRRKSAARLLDFFARTERLEILAADWAPRVRLSCLCMDGLLLVQDWVEGECLGASSAIKGWTSDALRQFLLSFVAAVESLHKAGLAHGDLKPDNIVIVRNVDTRSPRRHVHAGIANNYLRTASVFRTLAKNAKACSIASLVAATFADTSRRSLPGSSKSWVAPE